MVKARKIIDYIERIAPPSLQSDTDNSGIQLGDTNKDVDTLCIAFEKDLVAVQKAIKNKCDMLVTHRPLFLPKRYEHSHSPLFNRIENLVRDHDILLYSAHESWDLAQGGTGDSLAKHLRITVTLRDTQYRIGTIKPVKFADLSFFSSQETIFDNPLTICGKSEFQTQSLGVLFCLLNAISCILVRRLRLNNGDHEVASAIFFPIWRVLPFFE